MSVSCDLEEWTQFVLIPNLCSAQSGSRRRIANQTLIREVAADRHNPDVTNIK